MECSEPISRELLIIGNGKLTFSSPLGGRVRMGLTAFRVGLLSVHAGTSDNVDYRKVPTRRKREQGT